MLTFTHSSYSLWVRLHLVIVRKATNGDDPRPFPLQTIAKNNDRKYISAGHRLSIRDCKSCY